MTEEIKCSFCGATESQAVLVKVPFDPHAIICEPCVRLPEAVKEDESTGS